MKISDRGCALIGVFILTICGFGMGWFIDWVLLKIGLNLWGVCKWAGMVLGIVIGALIQMIPSESEDEDIYDLTQEDIKRIEETRYNLD